MGSSHNAMDDWPEEQRIDIIAQNGNTGAHYKSGDSNPYLKSMKGIQFDVYDVLVAFNVTNPALQHALKKMLCAGQRGYKATTQDIDEAIKSLQRAKELL